MARIGIYSGTFNPPHLGHVRSARYAMEALGLTELLVIPDGIPPHKPLPGGSPTPRQRLELVELAFAGEAGVTVLSYSVAAPEPVYSWQTVERIARERPHDELFFLLGSDMLRSFHQWREPDKILERAALAVMCRGDRTEREAICQAQAALSGKVVTLSNPVTEISSTQLRRLLAFGAAGPFLPPGVENAIRRQGLYAAHRSLRGLSQEALADAVCALLDPRRVAHVLGCRDTAVALARHWGADENDAARAALLHDITKALDGPLQLTICGEYGIILDKFSQRNPKTLHALTGSLVAERVFGETEAVVSAIASHTTGKPAMSLLEKIIYVADYMEPNRDFPGVERLRALAYEDITAALKLGLEMTLTLLTQRGAEISPESREALAWLEGGGIGKD